MLSIWLKYSLREADRGKKNEKKLRAGQLVTGSGQGRGVPAVPAVPGCG